MQFVALGDFNFRIQLPGNEFRKGFSRFSVIRPNNSVTMKLPEGKTESSFELPEEYRASNVIVEVLGGGKIASKAVYASVSTTGFG